VYEESLALKRSQGDSRGIAGTLNNLGMIASAKGDFERARSLYNESLELLRVAGNKTGVAVVLGNLGAIMLDQHDPRAGPLFAESLRLFQELGEPDGVAECLEGLAGVAAAEGRLTRAVRLYGAAEALRESIGAPLIHVEQQRVERTLSHIRASMEPAAYDQARAEGRAMKLDAAIGYALAGMNHHES
jgi:tetratricopeptide (TPR) repeat protein